MAICDSVKLAVVDADGVDKLLPVAVCDTVCVCVRVPLRVADVVCVFDGTATRDAVALPVALGVPSWLGLWDTLAVTTCEGDWDSDLL